jgi:ribosome-associated toxin RatA of RatAB toxin-antitoxin module
MRLEHAIHVNAPIDRVYAVMADVARWPEFMGALNTIRIISEDRGVFRVEMHEEAGRFRDAAIYRVELMKMRGLRATLEKGALKECEVVWRLDESANSTDVYVLHVFRLGWPLLGALLDRYWVGPKIIHKVVSRSLENLKCLVETGRSNKRHLGVVTDECSRRQLVQLVH